MPAVAAPADKRFRRAHVKPGRKRGAAIPACLDRRPSRDRVAASWRMAGGEGRRWSSARRRCRCRASRCAGTSGWRPVKCWRSSSACAERNILAVRLDEWQERLLSSPWVEKAQLRRVLPSTIDIEIRSAGRSVSGGWGAASIWSMRAESSSTSTDRTTGISICRSSTASRARRARARRPSTRTARGSRRGCWRRCKRVRISPPACRRSTSPTRTTPS